MKNQFVLSFIMKFCDQLLKFIRFMKLNLIIIYY